MNVYLGQTRSRSLIRRIVGLGFGECTQRGEVPPRRLPWFLDNGAFRDWTKGAPFDDAAFTKTVEAAKQVTVPPRFVVVPDLVARGLDSLRFSLGWVDALSDALDCRRFLAVQDGMSWDDVWPVLGDSMEFNGVFVGGTQKWKVATSPMWVDRCKGLVPVHIGRIGTPKQVEWARMIGPDSVDSCAPLWDETSFRSFVAALNESTTCMFSGEQPRLFERMDASVYGE